MNKTKTCYNCRYRDYDDIDRNIDFCSIHIKSIEEIEDTLDIQKCESHKFISEILEEKVIFTEYYFEDGDFF